jgi:nitrite reductase/ring-hydroxylating ferredoxin subunit
MNSCDTCVVASRRQFLQTSIGLLVSAAMPLSAQGAERRYAIPAEGAVAVDKENGVLIARVGSNVFAFSLACPHQNTALRWDDKDHQFRCPKHKSQYQPDGAFIAGKATRGLDRFAVRRDGAELAVNLDVLYRQDKEAAEWAGAVATV